jgi:hypothetical protein
MCRLIGNPSHNLGDIVRAQRPVDILVEGTDPFGVAAKTIQGKLWRMHHAGEHFGDAHRYTLHLQSQGMGQCALGTLGRAIAASPLISG